MAELSKAPTFPHNQTERRPHTWKKTKKTTETVAQPDNSKKEHEKLKMETLGSFSGGTKQPAADTAGPKACTTCRLAHVACDRFVAPLKNKINLILYIWAHV
jgi:hypothetical protein